MIATAMAVQVVSATTTETERPSSPSSPSPAFVKKSTRDDLHASARKILFHAKLLLKDQKESSPSLPLSSSSSSPSKSINNRKLETSARAPVSSLQDEGKEDDNEAADDDASTRTESPGHNNVSDIEVSACPIRVHALRLLQTRSKKSNNNNNNNSNTNKKKNHGVESSTIKMTTGLNTESSEVTADRIRDHARRLLGEITEEHQEALTSMDPQFIEPPLEEDMISNYQQGIPTWLTWILVLGLPILIAVTVRQLIHVLAWNKEQEQNYEKYLVQQEEEHD